MFGNGLLNEFSDYTFLYFDSDMEESIIVDENSIKLFLSSTCQYAFTVALNLMGRLWNIKDSCADLAFAICYSIDAQLGTILRPGVHFCDPEGCQKDIVFTREEILNATIFSEAVANMTERDKKPDNIMSLEPGGILRNSFLDHDYNQNNRIARGEIFLGLARTTPFLPIKISLYMASLECLFTNGHENITANLTHRASRYYDDTDFDTIQVYGVLKKGYAIRSNFLHGGTLKIQNIAKQKEISRNLDKIIRSIYLKGVFEDSYKFMNNQKYETEALYAELDFLYK